MAEYELGSFGETHLDTITDTASSWANPQRTFSRFMVVSDRAAHFARDRDATQNDVKVPTDTPCYIDLEEGQSLSWIYAAGETDGEIRITGVSG